MVGGVSAKVCVGCRHRLRTVCALKHNVRGLLRCDDWAPHPTNPDVHTFNLMAQLDEEVFSGGKRALHAPGAYSREKWAAWRLAHRELVREYQRQCAENDQEQCEQLAASGVGGRIVA